MGTDKQQLCEGLFEKITGRSLPGWVASRYAERPSWRRISRELFAETDGAVDVTDVSLAKWYGDQVNGDGEPARPEGEAAA